MSLSKSLIVALGLIFGLATFAAAAPRQMQKDADYTSADSIPGKAQQDHFTVSN